MMKRFTLRLIDDIMVQFSKVCLLLRAGELDDVPVVQLDRATDPGSQDCPNLECIGFAKIE